MEGSGDYRLVQLAREVDSLRAWRHDAEKVVSHLKARVYELERRVSDIERAEPDVTRAQATQNASAINWLRASYIGLMLMLTTLFSTLFASGKL